MPSPRADDVWIDRFIRRLESLAPDEREPDRATLAKLRRGLGKPVGHAAERDIWVFANLGDVGPEKEEAAALVASLFALHPKSGQGGLGDAFRQLHKQRQESPSIEKRFAVLLDAEREDLPHRLRQAISLLKADEIPLDWKRLLKDLIHWEREDRRVQRYWARQFWSGRSSDDAAETEPASLQERSTP
ncbi:MAG: type I-E CRISPR-associated protein Cse2/CasB [Planctomycetes bacterium]|nr:type I-E CRISPR-associated protein Cse2/CasB [Planctomycetota bacterium]